MSFLTLFNGIVLTYIWALLKDQRAYRSDRCGTWFFERVVLVQGALCVWRPRQDIDFIRVNYLIDGESSPDRKEDGAAGLPSCEPFSGRSAAFD